MQLTCTAWVASRNTREGGRGKTYSFCQKHRSLSLHDLLWNGRYLLGLSLVTNLKSSLSTALATQNTRENNSIILQAQNATALQLSVFLNGMYQLLDTKKGCDVNTTSEIHTKKLFSGFVRLMCKCFFPLNSLIQNNVLLINDTVCRHIVHKSFPLDIYWGGSVPSSLP